MEDYMEVFQYDNSEPEDAWWNEEPEYEWTDETMEEVSVQESQILNDILETLNSTQSYGTLGDYYHQAIGCYVFPNHEVYEYFIDTDAVGHEWAEASDGHYLPLLYLDTYEAYISGDMETEETGPEEPEEILPSETELQTLETLESIRGMLTVIKENNTSFYESVQEYETEMLVLGKETDAKMTGILYTGIVADIFLAIIAGSFISHTFFGRMKAG